MFDRYAIWKGSLIMTWWKKYEQLYLDSISMLDGILNRLAKDKIIKDFFSDYRKEVLTQFVFESNTIEREGLSEGDTRKLIFSNYDKFLELRGVIKELSVNVDDLLLLPPEGKLDWECAFLYGEKKRMHF